MSNEDAKFTIDDHTEQAIARLPSAYCDAENLKKWISIHIDRLQVLENVIRDIRTSILFYIPTAEGVFLDQIGTILVLPRQGRTDYDYRVLLRTQALLVLPGRGTSQRLLEIIRSLSDTDAGTITYRQFNPKSFQIGVSTATLEALASWIPILRRCRPATYNMLVAWFTVGHMTFQDASNPILEPAPVGAVGMGDASGTIAPQVGHGGMSGLIPIP